MATYRSVTTKLDEAERLFDLASIERDFRRCRRMSERLSFAPTELGLDIDLIDALATAIPIVYARPFIGGVRIRVYEIVEEYNSGEQDLHKKILDIRSKYAAHSVNGMEQQTLCIQLIPEEYGREINSVSAGLSSVATLTGGSYAALIAMCDKAVKWLRKEKQVETEALKQLLLDRYSIDEIYALDMVSMPGDELDNFSRGRSRANKSRDSSS